MGEHRLIDRMIWIETEKGVVVNVTESGNVTEGIVDVVDQEVDPENDAVTVEEIGQGREIGIDPLSRIKDQDQKKKGGDQDLILERGGDVLVLEKVRSVTEWIVIITMVAPNRKMVEVNRLRKCFHFESIGLVI